MGNEKKFDNKREKVCKGEKVDNRSSELLLEINIIFDESIRLRFLVGY